MIPSFKETKETRKRGSFRADIPSRLVCAQSAGPHPDFYGKTANIVSKM
jgi:hypothetical protein